MYKLEREYWSIIKTFLLYLNRYPQVAAGSPDIVDIDNDVKRIARRPVNEDAPTMSVGNGGMTGRPMLLVLMLVSIPS